MSIRVLAASAALLATASQCLPAQAAISHQHVASLGSVNGVGETVAYDAGSGRFFVTNPGTSKLDVYVYSAGLLSQVSSIGVAGPPTSVDVHDGLVAVAIEGWTKQSPGKVQFFDAASGAQAGNYVYVGALPAMLTFTPDGTKVVVADEGEADAATGLNNPAGSVSIVDVATRTAATASFVPWDGQKNALKAAGVCLASVNGIKLSQDVEPEFVAISAAGDTAYVTLQENNAMAVVDIATATVTDIRPLGEKDHGQSGNELDVSDQDGINGNFQNWPVKGLYMPDGVTAFTVNGVEYLATANEGAGRSGFAGFEDESRGNVLESNFWLETMDPTPETNLYTSAELNDDALLGRLVFATSPYDLHRGDTDGDNDTDQLYAFGARSFAIWDTAGNLVFDSGDALERAMLAHGLWKDGRSDEMGPEPDSIVFGEVGGVPYLFVGLEGADAICAFDVSDPTNATLADVIDIPGESGMQAFAPEGLRFLDASASPLGVDTLAVASEVGGVLSLFALDCSVCAAGSSVGVGCKSLELESTVPTVMGDLDMELSGADGTIAFFVFGDVILDPAVDMASLGAPGCWIYTDGNLGTYIRPVVNASAFYSQNMVITASLLGCEVSAQAAAFTPHNALGLATSNGVYLQVGL